MEDRSNHTDRDPLKLTGLLLILLILAPLTLSFVATGIQGWHYVFDDSFITYRYARNLAEGNGLRWNVDEPPTEGYTNLLLILILAPCIRAGLDPLTVTRLLSCVAAGAIVLIFYRIARGSAQASAVSAFLASLPILLAPETKDLCLLGLETVLYAFLLVVSMLAASNFLRTNSLRDSIFFSSVLFLTCLARPEAVLVYPIILVCYLGLHSSEKATVLRPGLGLAIFLLLGLTYLAWKFWYFGQLLPNPFYIKASTGHVISSMGKKSVLNFLQTHSLLLALTLLSCFIFSGSVKSLIGDWKPMWINKPILLASLSFVIANILFYLQTDTLMDAFGRFLYPLVPLMILINLPIITTVWKALESGWSKSYVLTVCMGIAYFFVFNPGILLSIYDNFNLLTPNDYWKYSNSLMQKERRVASSLSLFPGINRVRIAFGDSGVIAYMTDALWLDVVGLNNTFIAHTRQISALVNYFFSWNPDLVICGGAKDHTWVQYGHGPLGDFTRWARDPRWDRFDYVGTCRTAGNIYDLHFFVNRSSSYAARLTLFLKLRVIDGYYKPFPIAIGTYQTEVGALKWIPVPSHAAGGS